MNEQKEEPKRKIKTLGELGNCLPIFTGKENNTFSFKDWDMETEEKLSDLQEKSKNVGEFVRQMMNILLDEFQGNDWAKLSEEEKLITLSQMHFPNMMYLYIALRVEELGHELAFDAITCPSCRKLINDYRADLRTLEIIMKEDKESLSRNYDLKKPILIGDKLITGLKLGVTKWGALEKVPADKASNGAVVKRALFESSIEGALHNGEPLESFVDLKTIVKNIKKIDIEKIGKLITENNGGPDMKVGGECPHCKAEFVKPIEWGYEIFFDSSSL